MKTIYRTLLFLLLFGCTFASDFNPPEWRGLPGSTYQKWSFSNSETSPVADDYNNPYGTPRVTQAIDGDWYDQRYNHQGIWSSAEIYFWVPNDTGAMNDTKYRVQIIGIADAFPATDVNLYIRNSLGAVPVVQADIIDLYHNSGWFYATFEATAASFDPIPIVYYEARSRSGGYSLNIYVDEIILDTITIPEPATLLLISLGGLVLRQRRK